MRFAEGIIFDSTPAECGAIHPICDEQAIRYAQPLLLARTMSKTSDSGQIATARLGLSVLRQDKSHYIQFSRYLEVWTRFRHDGAAVVVRPSSPRLCCI
jgi:hypothetical protein